MNDAYHGGDFMTFEDADLANWRAAADVNIWGSLQMVKAVLPAMKAQGDGRIVNIVTQGVEWVLPTFGANPGRRPRSCTSPSCSRPSSASTGYA